MKFKELLKNKCYILGIISNHKWKWVSNWIFFGIRECKVCGKREIVL